MANSEWFLPTNTNNLSMILSQGLITEPAGCKKYYEDILNKHPRYIPVIKRTDKKALQDAFKYSNSEGVNLVHCIISIDLTKIVEGTFFCEDCTKVESSSIVNLDEEITVLYIPSPLPLQCISKVIFESKKCKEEYVKVIKTQYNNVSLTSLKLNITKSLFNQDLLDTKQNNNNSLPERKKIDYSKIYAVGGILGSLFYFTKNGNTSEKYFLDFSKFLYEENTELDTDYQLIKKYFFENDDSQSETLTKIFFPILCILIKNEAVKDQIIESLNNNGLKGNLLKRSEEIAQLLTDYSRSKIKDRNSDIFENKSKIEKLLLMLFIKDKTETLFKYNLDIFKEVDYCLFAILFGMKDKYVDLPSFLKEYNGMQSYLSNMMANYAHLLLKSDIRFKEVKPPITFNTMLNIKSADFIKKFEEIIKLNDCFKTIMPNKIYTNDLGKCTYQGIVLPKFEKVDDNFFKSMSQKEVNDKLYNKIIAKYKKYK